MGSYINIGLIAEKKDFKEKVIKLVSTLNEFCCRRIDYPMDEEYSGWTEIQIEQCGIDVAIDYCIEYNMAKIMGNFKLGEYEINDVLFQVELLSDNTYCLLIKMPGQQNNFFDNIDKAEEIIIGFFKEISLLGFSKGFCDSEAVAEDVLGYAIFVDYEPSINIILQSWKIDGLTSRE